MELCERFKIGVFGSADGNLEHLTARVQTIGREIANNNGVLVTGACPGLPHKAALAAREAGGIILGVSPAINICDHVYNFRFPKDPYVLIFTGQGKKGRNVVSVRSCDAAIFVSGRIGTLNEFTIFWDEAGPFHVMGFSVGSGGVVDHEIPQLINRVTQEKPSAAYQVWEKDPVVLVEQIFHKLKELRKNERS